MNKEFEKIIEKLQIEQNKADEKCKDIVVNDGHSLEYEFYNGKSIAYKHAIEIVKQEAKQYNNGWIPCSERLPDDFMSFEYLTIRKGHTLATITYYCVVNHKWYLSRNSSKEIDVIAWKPLPQPYHPKGE